MMPRLGEKYDIEPETISKPREECNTHEYFELDLPVAPAVMVGEEIVVEGSDVSDEKLEAVMWGHLGLGPSTGKNLLAKLFESKRINGAESKRWKTFYIQ